MSSQQWGPARSTIKIDVPTTKNSGRKNNFCLESDHHHQWSIDYVFWQPLLLAYSSVLEDCADWWNTRFICKPRFLHLSLGVQGVAIYWSTLALIIRLTAFDVNDASRSGLQLQHQYANWQMSWLDILMIGYQETSKTSSTWNCWNMKNPLFSWCRQWVMAHFWQHTPCQDQSSATYSPFLLFTQTKVEGSTVVTNLWKCFWQNLLRCCDRISFLCTLEFGMCSLKCIGQVFSKLFEKTLNLKTLNLMIVTAV